MSLKRNKHCAFAVLNSAGRCVADCIYNHKNRKLKLDCTGKKGEHHDTTGHEVQLKGRRIA